MTENTTPKRPLEDIPTELILQRYHVLTTWGGMELNGSTTPLTRELVFPHGYDPDEPWDSWHDIDKELGFR